MRAGAKTLDLIKCSGPTPADDMTRKIFTNCENFTINHQETFILCLFQMNVLHFHLKRKDLTIEQHSIFLSLSPDLVWWDSLGLAEDQSLWQTIITSYFFPSTQLSIIMLGDVPLLKQWALVTYSPCGGNQWLSAELSVFFY